MSKVHLSHMYAWHGQDLLFQTHLAYVTEYVNTQSYKHKMLHHCHISSAQNGFDHTVLLYSNAGYWKQSCHPEKAYHSPTQPCLTAYCIWHNISMIQAFHQVLQVSVSLGMCIWGPIYQGRHITACMDCIHCCLRLVTAWPAWPSRESLNNSYVHMSLNKWVWQSCSNASSSYMQRQLLLHLNIVTEEPV
jgi:hypothetical protein